MHLNAVVTLHCNLRCAHCIYACPAPGHVDPASFARTLDDLVPHGLRSLTFTGGEPCAHPDLAALVGAAAGRGLRFGIVTNAWSFAAYGEAVRRHRALFTGFHLSLDGLEERHDALRGEGSFRRVLEAMAWCGREGVAWEANLTLRDGNLDDLEGVATLCRERGARALKLAGLIPMPRAPGVRLSDENREGAVARAAAFQAASGFRVDVASSLLTPATVEFCPVMTSSTLTLDPRGVLTWCCDVPGGSSSLGAAGAPAPDQLDRRRRIRDEMTLDRILRLREGPLPLADRSCAYCRRFFGVEGAHEA